MIYNSQVRKEIKKAAKLKTKEQLGRCIAIQFLAALPGVLLIVMLYVAIFGRLMVAALSGESGNLNDFININMVWLIMIAIFVVGGAIHYGLIRFYINLHREEEASVSMLFQPFMSLRSFWAAIRMSFCMLCRQLAWSFVPMFVMFIGIFMFFYNMGISHRYIYNMEILGYIILFALAVQVIMIPIYVKMMSYQAGWIELYDNEEISVWEATRISADAFRGHYGKLFGFEASFWGWYILDITIGILMGVITNVASVSMPSGQAMMVVMMTMAAGGFLRLVISSFVAAYHNAAFFGLYDQFTSKAESVGKSDFTAL